MDTELLKHLQTYLTEHRNNRFQKVISERTRHFTVVTEDVYQLHNTSAVMRTCDVFGIQDLNVVEEKVSKRIDKEIAMGAQKWVDLKRYHSIKECIKDLKNNEYQILATTPHDNSTMLHDFDVSKKSAFFFGKESDGLSDTVMNAADGFLKIPMYGFTESLNISVSAAIILQSVVSKMKQSDVNWQLSKEEKFELEMQWLKKTIKASEEIIERYNSENSKSQEPNSK
ncbi:TrmH family RNA methyltransferase [Aequorivita lipolytica]|uniref:tRNA (guanosine(18)-2'-O)-methyltransferase n=1 Tax=Aequorivita lipolytica TaxID=153267 RepID=A0A5C6YRE1_9FLAO|nr:RNA methyltransferase [Aequorivita lipolytica]TXD69452.1 RNA methyltransferase [Aequorivita lipolytica]SRX50925.1 tRNA (guanosine(18)-2'-O)-methyltransferase [Aequorivita lipolytica]